MTEEGGQKSQKIDDVFYERSLLVNHYKDYLQTWSAQSGRDYITAFSDIENAVM